jgi:hypothetical protein
MATFIKSNHVVLSNQSQEIAIYSYNYLFYGVTGLLGIVVSSSEYEAYSELKVDRIPGSKAQISNTCIFSLKPCFSGKLRLIPFAVQKILTVDCKGELPENVSYTCI